VLVKAADPSHIRSKYKPITAFFAYAVWQERNGQHKALDVLLRVVRASKRFGFMWNRIRPLVVTLLDKQNNVSVKRIAILASPHLWLWKFPASKHLIQSLAVAVSEIPYADEVGTSVVDTMLQVAFNPSLRSSIPPDMWSWLNKRPSLPPVCWGRYLAGHANILQTVRALRDTETLKSFLLLVWSEWNGPYSHGLKEMHTAIREDLGEIGMWRHREDLLRHLDNVLGQLDLGLEHMRRHDPGIDKGDIQRRRDQYRRLRGALLEADRGATETLIREPLRLTIVFCLLIPIDRHKIPLDIYVCNSSPVSVVARLGYSPRSGIHPITW